MLLNISYPAILDLFREHLDPRRSESASFLIWYLENYLRLDKLEAIDSVCDQKGDKGVDGIFVNDADQTITVFQARISQKDNTSIGDSSLREFCGTLTQFATPESIQTLIAGAGTAQVAALARRLDLVNRIKTHELRGEFLSNVDLDENGVNFLKSAPSIVFVGRTRLLTTYISDSRDLPSHAPIRFDVAGFDIAQYTVNSTTKAVIAHIKANELVKLDGIADQSLYAYNVRGPLGRTQVNKDIVKSINDKTLHKVFPLFHNGITVIARDLKIAEETLTISEYYVVNGCQSLTSLFDNQKTITDDLRVLTKFVQMDPTSPLAEIVTRFSNNQNGVKARDFMANNSMQIRLQNEFKKNYGGQYVFEIKRGESLPAGTVLSNETAGLLLMAFDLREPWATHRKYQVFEDKHADLFGRPEATSDHIVMCQVIMEAIDATTPAITNTLLARYVLTKYLLLYIAREILDSDPIAKEAIKTPKKFVRDRNDRDRFRGCVAKIIDEIIIDLNAEISEYGNDFDYRDKLRDADWSRGLAKKVVADHLKLVKRCRIQSFWDEWVTSAQPGRAE